MVHHSGSCHLKPSKDKLSKIQISIALVSFAFLVLPNTCFSRIVSHTLCLYKPLMVLHSHFAAACHILYRSYLSYSHMKIKF